MWPIKIFCILVFLAVEQKGGLVSKKTQPIRTRSRKEKIKKNVSPHCRFQKKQGREAEGKRGKGGKQEFIQLFYCALALFCILPPLKDMDSVDESLLDAGQLVGVDPGEEEDEEEEEEQVSVVTGHDGNNDTR